MRLAILVLAASGLLAGCSQAKAGAQQSDIPAPVIMETAEMTATSFTAIDGEPMDLTALGAKAVLVVNTASRCGFTGQYAGLQALYEARRDDGLVIVGVPSNDFGGQEPGTEEEVKTFCEINYGVTFPLTRKYEVTGAGQHPFFRAAVDRLGDAAQPKWNFHKILVSGDGTPLTAYPSSIRPGDAALEADIDAALKS